MLAFYIALAAGVLIGIAYLAMAARSFVAVRSRILAGSPEGLGSDATYDAQGHGFNWKAAAGVVVSIACLSLLATGPVFFYVIPFLALCSAAAVVCAFVVDPDGSN
jgi:hypothetical protein